MSYIKLFDDVDIDGFRKLVHSKLIQEADSSLVGSSLSVRLALEGELYKRGQNIFELRIAKSVVKRLIKKAKQGHNTHVCLRISELYRTGLGLPLSKECHLLWDCLANGYAPKINGRVFSYANMLQVLLAHWRHINSANIDPNWLYFNPHQDYFNDLIRPTFITSVREQYIEKRKPFAAFQKIEGVDCTLVYRTSLEGESTLYAAYANVNEKLLNVTVQALKAKGVPRTIGPNPLLKQFGPFTLVSGVLTIKRRPVNKLKKYWGATSTVLSLIRSSLNQDVYRFADLEGYDIPSNHPSAQFVGKYRAKYRRALKFIESCKGSKKTRKLNIRISKAQKLVAVFEQHQETVNTFKEEKQKLSQFDIVSHLDFVALDMYGFEAGSAKRITTPYNSVRDFLSKLSFTVVPMVTPTSTIAGTVKRLERDSLVGYLSNGVIYRMKDNSKKLNSVNWFKVKL